MHILVTDYFAITFLEVLPFVPQCWPWTGSKTEPAIIKSKSMTYELICPQPYIHIVQIKTLQFTSKVQYQCSKQLAPYVLMQKLEVWRLG